MTEKNGHWDITPHDIPGTGGTIANSLSCTSAGNCSADGDGYSGTVPWVATEHNGTWTKIQRVPGLGLLNHGKGFRAAIANVSCATPGNCAATGWANIYAR